MGVWGAVTFSAGQMRCYRVGAVTLWVTRRGGEWWVHHQLGAVADVATEAEGVPVSPDAVLERIAGGQDACQIRPVLPDRPMVVRPDVPLGLLPRESLTLFVTTPVWLRVLSSEADPRVIAEIPSVRSSDTWFGATPMQGELCYASRTKARREAAPMHSRVTTSVTIVNKAPDTLKIERLKLPVASLAVYEDGKGLWTPPVTVTRKDPGSVELQIGAAPKGAKRLSAARDPNSNVLTRAMGALLG